MQLVCLILLSRRKRLHKKKMENQTSNIALEISSLVARFRVDLSSCNLSSVLPPSVGERS